MFLLRTWCRAGREKKSDAILVQEENIAVKHVVRRQGRTQTLRCLHKEISRNLLRMSLWLHARLYNVERLRLRDGCPCASMGRNWHRKRSATNVSVVAVAFVATSSACCRWRKRFDSFVIMVWNFDQFVVWWRLKRSIAHLHSRNTQCLRDRSPWFGILNARNKQNQRQEKLFARTSYTHRKWHIVFFTKKSCKVTKKNVRNLDGKLKRSSLLLRRPCQEQDRTKDPCRRRKDLARWHQWKNQSHHFYMLSQCTRTENGTSYSSQNKKWKSQKKWRAPGWQDKKVCNASA